MSAADWSPMLLRDVLIDGQRRDVRFGRSIDGIRPAGQLDPQLDEEVFDGCGLRLIPGLHDHHLHLLAMAAAFTSVDVSSGLQSLTRSGEDHGWVRAVGYHESTSGPISREILDSLAPDRPVRVQHSSGAAWFVNTAALRELGLDERFPDGVLMRADDLLAQLLTPSADPPDLATVGRTLSAYGITGVTDATPDLTDSARRLIAVAGETGELPQRVHYLSPGKLVLSDHELPTLDELSARIGQLHADGHPVALHSVTRESLALAIAALTDVGVRRGDRIEHGALIDAVTTRTLASLGVTVVTQPGFIADRGERYLRELPATDHPDLYRYCSLLDAGTCTVPSSDAPFGPLDPWLIMKTAAARTDLPAERVAFDAVLDGYLRPLEDVHQPARQVIVGAPADLVLTDGESALATWIDGRRVHAASAGSPAPG